MNWKREREREVKRGLTRQAAPDAPVLYNTHLSSCTVLLHREGVLIGPYISPFAVHYCNWRNVCTFISAPSGRREGFVWCCCCFLSFHISPGSFILHSVSARVCLCVPCVEREWGTQLKRGGSTKRFRVKYRVHKRLAMNGRTDRTYLWCFSPSLHCVLMRPACTGKGRWVGRCWVEATRSTNNTHTRKLRTRALEYFTK